MISTSPTPPISTGLRLGAMLLDHFFMCFIAMLFFLPGMFISFSQSFSESHETVSAGFMSGPAFYIGMIGFALYFCKDVVNGRSLAKRILKLQVVKNSSGDVASPLQCLVRNLFCVIWPVEAVMAMVNPQRRLGDLVAGTKLVMYNPATEQPKPAIIKMLLPFIIAYGCILLLAEPLSNMGIAAPKYSPTSANPVAAKKLGTVLQDSLGQYGTVSVQVYDTIYNSRLRYVSVVMRLHQNYLADENRATALQRKTEELIYSEMPENTINGFCKFVYRGDGQFQSREVPIGITIVTTQ